MNVLENMSSEKYIYPVLNESFTNNIGNRFEFDIPVIKENNTCETDDFKLAPYQIFLKNYISNDTPYNSILLYI